MDIPRPTDLILHRASRVLEVAFDDGSRFQLPAEYLRVNSPSAEVQGHGPGQRVLLGGKREIAIDTIQPVGNYAVLLRFSDGHASGIFSWNKLHALGLEQQRNWDDYLAALEAAGLTRDQPGQTTRPR